MFRWASVKNQLQGHLDHATVTKMHELHNGLLDQVNAQLVQWSVRQDMSLRNKLVLNKKEQKKDMAFENYPSSRLEKNFLTMQ